MRSSKLERFGLRARLIAMVVGVVTIVVGLISTYFILQHRKASKTAAEGHIEHMRLDIVRHGVEQVRQLALVAQRVILVMDPHLSDGLLRGLTANDHEVLYAAIVDGNGRAMAHSNPQLDGHEVDVGAVEDDVVTRVLSRDGRHILEATGPITVGERRWGSVVIGFSLARLDDAIAHSYEAMQRQTSHDVLMTLWIALGLMVVGSAGGAYLSNRISRPLIGMLESVSRIRSGDMNERVAVRGSVEFVTLAEAFNEMVVEVRAHMKYLEDALGEAREASRIKSEFLANVSHELRTPLNAIVNVPTQLIKDCISVSVWTCTACTKISESPECQQCGRVGLERTEVVRFSGDAATHRHFLARLRGQARHLLNVVNDLLDFSKLDAHMMQLQYSEFDVGQLLEKTRESLVGLAAEKGLRLATDISTAPRACLGDELRLSQVLINLIGNAIKFTNAGGEVRVVATTASRNGWPLVRFAVVDTGIGIAPEDIGGIFESFRQVDGSHTRAHGGTGVESVVGVGSTFWFEIPLGATHRVSGDSRVTELVVQPLKRIRDKPMVLVIDDNEVHLEIARMILDKDGFETVLMADARTAVDRIRHEQPDLVILDVMMPEVSGITVLQQLKATSDTKEIPVFIASAYSSNREIVERLGGLWLPKPWDGERLAGALRTELERRKQEASSARAS